jgi:hypothetical protein
MSSWIQDRVLQRMGVGTQVVRTCAKSWETQHQTGRRFWASAQDAKAAAVWEREAEDGTRGFPQANM